MQRKIYGLFIVSILSFSFLVGCAVERSGRKGAIAKDIVPTNAPIGDQIAAGIAAAFKGMQFAGASATPVNPPLGIILSAIGTGGLMLTDNIIKRRQIKTLKQPRQSWSNQQRETFRKTSAQLRDAGAVRVDPPSFAPPTDTARLPDVAPVQELRAAA